MESREDVSRSGVFPAGDPLPEMFARFFSGQCYLSTLVRAEGPFSCGISNVTFEPGSRNNWHRHPGGQILLVTAGRGWYQEEGGEARKLQAGEVVEIRPGVKHWHGAAADDWFAHIAISTNADAGPVEWLEPVSDAHYAKLA